MKAPEPATDHPFRKPYRITRLRAGYATLSRKLLHSGDFPHAYNIAWQDVDTVLLDMDGTLLDSPSITISGKSWCLKHGARKRGYATGSDGIYAPAISRRTATLNWYCLDYWSEQLGLDICA